MGSTNVVLGIHPREAEVFQPRKRFKTSDLPLSATQRSTIDELLHTIKKKGEYDTLRKKVWSNFVDSVSTFPTVIRLTTYWEGYLLGKIIIWIQAHAVARTKRTTSPTNSMSLPILKSTVILRFSRATVEKPQYCCKVPLTEVTFTKAWSSHWID